MSWTQIELDEAIEVMVMNMTDNERRKLIHLCEIYMEDDLDE